MLTSYGTTPDMKGNILSRWLIALSMIWLVFAGLGCGGRTAAVQFRPPDAQNKPCLEYKETTAAVSFTKAREPIGSHSYFASDGTRLTGTYFYYRSPQKATKELNRKVAVSGNEIIEDQRGLEVGGHKIGRRVVLRLKSESSDASRYQILWTEGANLYVLEGASLPHLLEFQDPNCIKK